jgi:hypothetical protein
MPTVATPGGTPNTLEIPGGAYAPELRPGFLRRPTDTGGFDYGITGPGPGGVGGIDPRFVNAVIGTESGGRNVVGKAGERGPMQIMPATARRMGVPVEALNDPNVNVQVGTQLLNRLYTKYHGDIYKTLAAYNAGEGAVDRGRIPASTQAYVQNVLRRVGAGGSQVLQRTAPDPTGMFGQALAQRLSSPQPGPQAAPGPQVAAQPPPKPFSEEGPEYYGAAQQRYQQFAKPGPYRTPLSAAEEGRFRQWLQSTGNPWRFDVNAKATDYDMRGYWKDIASKGRDLSSINPLDKRLHLVDTYKTPYDTTFSAESKYAVPGAPLKWVDGGTPQERLINTQTGQTMFQARPQKQSFLQGVEGALAPGTAEAAEPPSIEDIKRERARRAAGGAPAGPPSVADIERDRARRAAGPAAPPDEANAPWPVKAAGYLPYAGQMVGEYGAAALTAPATVASGGAAWPVEMAAQGVGGGGGYGGGELINRQIRSAYGYPNPPWSQEAKDTGVAASTSALMVPGLKLLKGVLPATLKAGLKARAGFGAAREAVESMTERLSQALGVSRREAEAIASTSSIIKQVPGRIEEMVARAERLPGVAKARAYNALRNTLAAVVHTAGDEADTALEKLQLMKAAMRRIPKRVFLSLYNTSREEAEQLLEETVQAHERFLQYPDLRAAVAREIEKAPRDFRSFISHKFRWLFGGAVLGVGLHGIATGVEEAMAVAAMAVPILGGSSVLNSGPAKALYRALLSAKSATQAARITKALIDALITSQVTGQNSVWAPSAEPVTGGGGGAEAAPSGPPKAGGLPPSPPPDKSGSTLEIPSTPSPAPPPDPTADPLAGEGPGGLDE